MRYEIEVNKAEGLTKIRSPDPYVIVEVAGVEKKTSKKKGLNCFWMETLVFDNAPNTDTIHFNVMDHDTFSKDDPMGEVTFDTKMLGRQKTFAGDLSLSLRGQPAGTLTVVIRAMP